MKWMKAGLGLMSAGLLLAACNGDDNGGDTTDTNGDDNGAADGEVIEIDFWHANERDALDEMTEEFNNSQDQYHVNALHQGDYSDLSQTVTAAAVANELPALAQVTQTNVVEYANNDLIADLSDEFLLEYGFSQETLDDIFEGFLETATYGDARYAMPFSKSTRLLYVNNEILEEYDAEIETWDDVVALGEDMVAAGDDRYAMGFENGFTMEIETLARQNGSNWVEEGSAELNSPETVEAWEFFNDMINDGYARTAGEDDFMSGPFGNGEVALYIGSSAGIGHVMPVADENGIDWSTAVLPTWNGEQLTLLAGNDISIFESASDEEREAAVAYIEFLLEPDNTAYWAADTGYVPVREAALQSEEWQELLEEEPYHEAPTQMVDYAIASPMFEQADAVRNLTLDAFDDIFVSGNEPQDVLDALQTDVEDLVN